jgi:hypothetical protein
MKNALNPNNMNPLEQEIARLRRLLQTLQEEATVEWPFGNEVTVSFTLKTEHPWGVKPKPLQVLGGLAQQRETSNHTNP